MEILYTSSSVSDKIRSILSNPSKGERRVVIVAFVGRQAEAFLPNPKGLEIVCWLRPGSTDAAALVRLRENGADIRKSDRLHMKVYWSSTRGCVMTSANASQSALAAGGLKEAGVWLPPRTVDIDKLLAEADPKPIGTKDLLKLAEATPAGVSPETEVGGNQPHGLTFAEWMALQRKGSSPKSWKLGWWYDESGRYSDASKKVTKLSYGKDEPNDVLDVKRGHVGEGEWLLSFKVPTGTHLTWMYVDFVVPVPKNDPGYEGYPAQAVQAVSLKLRPSPPFLLDPAFKKAMKGIAASSAYERFFERETTLVAPLRMLDELLAEYQRLAP